MINKNTYTSGEYLSLTLTYSQDGLRILLASTSIAPFLKLINWGAFSCSKFP